MVSTTASTNDAVYQQEHVAASSILTDPEVGPVVLALGLSVYQRWPPMVRRGAAAPR